MPFSRAHVPLHSLQLQSRAHELNLVARYVVDTTLKQEGEVLREGEEGVITVLAVGPGESVVETVND